MGTFDEAPGAFDQNDWNDLPAFPARLNTAEQGALMARRRELARLIETVRERDELPLPQNLAELSALNKVLNG